jgi:hypothetical protein
MTGKSLTGGIANSPNENLPHAAIAPSVGIFWGVADVLVTDRSTLAEAEAYGDCITHPRGHYECWQEWQALGGTRLVAKGYPAKIAQTEYDEWPRGRVVYETPANRFVLYADRQLQRPEIVAALKTIFGLATADVIVKSDLHYQTRSASWD